MGRVGFQVTLSPLAAMVEVLWVTEAAIIWLLFEVMLGCLNTNEQIEENSPLNLTVNRC